MSFPTRLFEHIEDNILWGETIRFPKWLFNSFRCGLDVFGTCDKKCIQIFRSDRYKSKPCGKFLLLMTSLPVLRSWIYRFYRGILSGKFLLYHFRYNVEIYRAVRQKTETVHGGLNLFLSRESSKLARTRKLKRRDFHGFLWISSFSIVFFKNI